MPTLLATSCSHPGCPNLNCQVHKRKRSVEHRASAAKRGYGRTWRKLRRMYLRAHPICEEPECEKASVDVHHIVALADGGTNAWDNLQALCHSCHSKKTAAEKRGHSLENDGAARHGLASPSSS